MTTTKARVATATPLGGLNALEAGKTQIETAKFRFRTTNQWGHNGEKKTRGEETL